MKPKLKKVLVNLEKEHWFKSCENCYYNRDICREPGENRCTDNAGNNYIFVIDKVIVKQKNLTKEGK